MPPLLTALVLAGVLFGLGLALRAFIPGLRAIHLPACVIGGLLGLALLRFGHALPGWSDGWSDAFAAGIAHLRGWPGPLLAVVFAGLLLQRPGRGLASAARRTMLAGLVVWIIVVGEIAVGLLVTWLVIMPFFDVPIYFGQLIEAGFAGGHGTATALGTVLQDVVDFEDALDLGLVVATIGLAYSVISGVIFVNIGVRRGWTSHQRRDVAPHGPSEDAEHDSVERWIFAAVLLAVSFSLGMALQAGFSALVALMPESTWRGALGNVPLFLFTLIAGLLLRIALNAVGLGRTIDNFKIAMLIGIAMDALILAALATLKLETLAAYGAPLVILIAAGCAWSAFCLFVVARRLLPPAYWFELGLIDYGMSTGTTAQGMMLLRLVDPELRTRAAEDYALAAPLSAPFIGGGVLTFALPVLLQRFGAAPVIVALFALIGIVTFCAIRLRRAAD